MDDKTKPVVPFSAGDPKHIAKTVIVEYTIGSYDGPEPPADGIYEKNVPELTFPDPGVPDSGGEYKFEGLVAQLFRTGDDAYTDDYDLFVYDLNIDAKTYSMRVQRTDEAAEWDDKLKSYTAFYFSE